eukprot:s979_g9.t1
MEHEQNVLMQLAHFQPDLDSNQDHSPRFRRFRRLRRRFRGYRRYGGKTTTRAPTTTTEESTTTDATTASTTTTGPTSTTTTGVVCNGTTDVELELGDSLRPLDPPQSEFTIESPETSNCQCVGGPVGDSIPGWLDVVVRGVEDPKNVSFISITSPNATEVELTPITTSSDVLFAGTVLFNGFQGVGNWSIKLLDASGTLSSQTGTRVRLRFAFISCSQILQVPDCVGNLGGGAFYGAQNFSLVGTTLSMSPSLLQFDVGASSSCCVPAFGSSSSQNNIRLILGFTTPAIGTVSVEGLSPSAIPFNLTGDINTADIVLARLTPGFVGSPAAGLWNLSAFMESGSAVIDDTNRDPTLILRVEPCS